MLYRRFIMFIGNSSNIYVFLPATVLECEDTNICWHATGHGCVHQIVDTHIHLRQNGFLHLLASNQHTRHVIYIPQKDFQRES